MDQFASISAFVQVANIGSFSGAARRLEMSPASVTARIRALEQQFGTRLFNRTTRHVSLTDEGEAFYERCKRILVDLAEIENLANALQAKPSGKLRLNADPALALIIAPLLGEYAASYPEISCELVITNEMVNPVEEKFDLLLVTGPLRDSALIARRLGSSPRLLCAAPSYLDRSGWPRHPKDLRAHNCLDLIGNNDRSWRFVGADGEHLIGISGNFRSNSFDALRASALAGHGICLLPLSLVAGEIANGTFVRLLAGYAATADIIQALYPPHPHLATKLRSLLDFLARRLRDDRSDAEPSIELRHSPRSENAQPIYALPYPIPGSPRRQKDRSVCGGAVAGLRRIRPHEAAHGE